MHQVDISLRDPEGEEVVHMDGEMQLAPGRSGISDAIRVPHVLNIDGLVFPRAGRYSFDVAVDGEHHVSIPLVVADKGAGAARA